MLLLGTLRYEEFHASQMTSFASSTHTFKVFFYVCRKDSVLLVLTDWPCLLDSSVWNTDALSLRKSHDQTRRLLFLDFKEIK